MCFNEPSWEILCTLKFENYSKVMSIGEFVVMFFVLPECLHVTALTMSVKSKSFLQVVIMKRTCKH
jgi:hypothetical protein